MINYKELLYRSLSSLASVVDELDSISQKLKEFMQQIEEEVISEKDKQINVISNDGKRLSKCIEKFEKEHSKIEIEKD